MYNLQSWESSLLVKDLPEPNLCSFGVNIKPTVLFQRPF